MSRRRGRRKGPEIKTITKDDLIRAEENAWKRIEVVEKLNDELYSIARGYAFEPLFDKLDDLYAISSPFRSKVLVIYRVLKNQGYVYDMEKRLKNDLASLLFFYYFINPRKIGGLLRKRTREVFQYLKSNDFLMDRNVSYYLRQVFNWKRNYRLIAEDLRVCIKEMVRMVRNYGRTDIIMKYFDEDFVSMNPLTRMIIRNILLSYRGNEEEGMRVGIFCSMGFGKTTYSFYSAYGALRFLRIDPTLAKEATSALILNDPLELLFLMQIVTDSKDRELRLPFLIADDIAAIISKYWTFGDKHTKQAAISFIRTLKISREKLGIIIMPSDVGESIPKGIRESIDLQVEGDGVVETRWKSVLWIYTEPTPTVKGGKNIFRAKELKSRGAAKTIYDIVGTVCPPLYTPDDVYLRLEEKKLEVRGKQLRKTTIELVKSIVSEEAEKEEEGAVEEVEEMGEP